MGNSQKLKPGESSGAATCSPCPVCWGTGKEEVYPGTLDICSLCGGEKDLEAWKAAPPDKAAHALGKVMGWDANEEGCASAILEFLQG